MVTKHLKVAFRASLIWEKGKFLEYWICMTETEDKSWEECLAFQIVI